MNDDTYTYYVVAVRKRMCSQEGPCSNTVSPPPPLPCRLVMEEEEEEEEGRVGSELAAANEAVPDIITMPSRFETPQGRGYIDVWWLYDDGGVFAAVSVSTVNSG